MQTTSCSARVPAFFFIFLFLFLHACLVHRKIISDCVCRNSRCSFIIKLDKSFLTFFLVCFLFVFFFVIIKERELEANKKEKVKEAQLEAEVKLLRKENEALRRHIAVLQAEVYGARLAAKYLDKELAGRYVESIHGP